MQRACTAKGKQMEIAQIVAAHQAGSMPWVILTAEREHAAATGPLAPRCGLFVLRPAKQ